MRDFAKKFPILLAYIYFSYFSVVIQSLIYFNGMSGSTSLRDAMLMSTVWLIPYLLFPKKSKITAATIGFMLWSASLVGLSYFLIYGQDFSQSAIFIIFESNVAEGTEFIQSYLQWWHIFIFLAYSLLPIIIWTKLQNVSISTLPRYTYAVLFFIIIFWPFFTKLIEVKSNKEVFNPIADAGNPNIELIKNDLVVAKDHLLSRLEPSAPWNIVVGYLKYREQLSSMLGLLDANLELPPVKHLAKNIALLPDTIVLILGESTNRQRMGIYGYQRDTTPRLEKLKKELTIFDNVISPRPYTIESLQQILSPAHEKAPELFYTQPNVINIFKQAGFEVTWITNQQTQSRRNTMLTAISQLAHHQVYLNNNRRQNAKQFDGVVIDPFIKSLQGPAPHKLIVVHLLGTHRKYDYRYPKNYDEFTDRIGAPEWIKDGNLKEYNSYDNAILYNDYVVSELISNLRKRNNKDLLVYFSDHGEEVFDYADKAFCGRNEEDPTPAMYTIPFITWESKKQKNSRKTQWSDYTSRAFMASDFYHTLPNMVGISFEGLNIRRSLISKEFMVRKRWIGDPYNPKKQKDFDAVDTFSD